MVLTIIIGFVSGIGFHRQLLFQIMINQRSEMMTIIGFP